MPRPADLAAGLAALDAASRRRRRPLVSTPQGPHLTVDGRIVFDVNMSVVTRAGLRVSPQMLRLARDVSGGAR